MIMFNGGRIIREEGEDFDNRFKLNKKYIEDKTIYFCKLW